MIRQRSQQPYPGANPLALLLIPLLLLEVSLGNARGQQATNPEAGSPNTSAPQAIAPRGQRMAREIKYSDWRKVCFKTPGTNMVCRTTVSGTFDTGQSAIRIDLIEREGDKAARLQMFLPVGLYLQAGVKITIDQGPPYGFPYVWCLTNTCIAADVADPKLIKDMETGQKLQLEVVDSSVLTVSTTLPLDQFATIRHGPPTQVFEQAIDE
jgi:invasion protein IalB